jgi:ribonucleoside-diphosphate reductase alpha chain
MFVEDTYSQLELEQPESERRKLNHEFPKRPVFNYTKLMHVVGVIVRNLNQVVDKNWYPTPKTEYSNFRHRPLGIGIQGLADVFFKFKTTYDSEIASDLNRRIFETIYYAAVSASSKLARDKYSACLAEFETKEFIRVNKIEYTRETLPKLIGSYSTFEGSPLMQGKFHFEMRGLTAQDLVQKFDWETLRRHVQTFGVRNSLFVALMPTASTSQIMGNIESFEPLTSNIFKRQTLAGEFIIVNKYLIHDLEEIGLWNKTVENYIKLNNGSIQSILGIPEEIKKRYRTVWEISQKHLIDLAADRQHFVDQSQSLNLFIEDLTFSKFNSMHFYGWKKNLKTGCYYLRTRQAANAQTFTVDPKLKGEVQRVEYIPVQNDDDVCLVCSS